MIGNFRKTRHREHKESLEEASVFISSKLNIVES